MGNLERWKLFSDDEIEVMFEAIRDLTSSKDRGEELKILYLELHEVSGDRRGWKTISLAGNDQRGSVYNATMDTNDEALRSPSSAKK